MSHIISGQSMATASDKNTSRQPNKNQDFLQSHCVKVVFTLHDGRSSNTVTGTIAEYHGPLITFFSKLTSNFQEKMPNHNHKSKPWPCNMLLLDGTKCPKVLSRQSHLRSHQMVFHAELTPFLCAECSYPAKDRHTLRVHFRSAHTSEGTFLQSIQKVIFCRLQMWRMWEDIHTAAQLESTSSNCSY